MISMEKDMEILTLENIASYCGGNIVNGDGFDAKITGAAIDSRKVEKGFIFFAYKGEKSDGHDYIAKAFEQGAAIVVCERVPEGVTGTCVVVPDTVKALKDIARSYREKLDIKVVGVTGSVGKTTTKEFIASVLSQKYNVFRTDKNQNNLIGLPLSILNISENNEVAVLEMGISEFGEMRELSSMAKPDICVITNISACHLESLGSLDGVFKAKTEIFEHMNPEGSVVVCGDDERLKNINDVNGKKPVTYGLDENNDVHAIKVLNRGLWGSECTIDNGEGMFTASVPLPGKHMVINALCASAVGRLLEVSPEQIGFGISCVKALDGRNNIIQKNGITIIDDCYNASPESMKQSLELLTEAVTPTVAILGDMFEQGENEDKSHEEVGEFAVEKNIGTIVCVGTRSKKMYDKAMMQAALKENIDVLYFATVDEAIASLGDYIKKNDTVLLKASNGMNFKRILEAMTSEDNKDMFKERTEGEQEQSDNTQASKDAYNDTVKADSLSSASKADSSSFSGSNQSETAASGTADNYSSSTQAEENKKVKKEKKVKTSDDQEKAGARRQLIIIASAVLVVLIGIGATIGIIKYRQYKEATQGHIVFYSSNGYCTKGMLENNVIGSEGNPGKVVWADEDTDEFGFNYDGAYIYYITRVDSKGNELVRCKKNGKKSEVLSDCVASYDVIKKGEVLYLSDGNLYLAKGKKSETNLIAEGVSEYFLNKKKTKVMYRTYSNDVNIVGLKKGQVAENIQKDVTVLEYTTDNFSELLYRKNDGLYIAKKGKDGKSISPDARELFIADNEKKIKLYFKDGDNKLWYYESGNKSASQIKEEYVDVLAKEFNIPALILLKEDYSLVLLAGKKTYNLDTAVGALPLGVDKKAGKIYYTDSAFGSGNTSLYSVSYKGMFKKGKTKVESTNVASVEYTDNKHVFVTKLSGDGTHDLYDNEALVARNIQEGSLMKTKYGDNFVFAYQVKDADGFYKIVIYDGKNIKDVGSSVDLKYVPLSKRKIYFMSKGATMFDIKYYNGKKVSTYIENINNFIYAH